MDNLEVVAFKSIALCVTFLSLGGLTSALAQERVTITDEVVDISFVPPAGLKPLAKEAVLAIYGRSNGAVQPKYAFADSKQDETIAVSTFGTNANNVELAEIKKAMEAGAEKNYQHFAWLSRGWVTINNQRWARINFKALNGELDTVNDIYVTAWLGKYVMFNFSSAVMQYESHKAAMEASAKTIALGFVANAPLDGKPVNHPAKRKP